MVLRWLFFGVVLAALIQATVPTEVFATWFGATLMGPEMDCVGGCFQPTQRMVGYINDMQLYDRVLSESEIQILAQQYQSQ